MQEPLTDDLENAGSRSACVAEMTAMLEERVGLTHKASDFKRPEDCNETDDSVLPFWQWDKVGDDDPLISVGEEETESVGLGGRLVGPELVGTVQKEVAIKS